MKKLPALLSCAIFLVILASLSCRKSNEPVTVTASASIVSSAPFRLNYQCANAPDYGDSILYLQPVKNDYIVSPVNGTVLGTGKFLSWPEGLVIDSSNGAINVSASETGMRYIIGFIKQGTSDTCVSNLILAGVTYADSIYILSHNDTLAVPYYNANGSVPAVCNASDEGDYPDNNGHGKGDDKCIFDGTDKHGNKEKANKKQVKVRTISGIINLKATLAAGAFGTNPSNGASVTAPIVYNLNDKSKKATQEISVQLFYYNRKADIPASMVNQVNVNRAAFFQNTAIFGSPRPPIIIVTRFE
jgi:hypothetical protein